MSRISNASCTAQLGGDPTHVADQFDPVAFTEAIARLTPGTPEFAAQQAELDALRAEVDRLLLVRRAPDETAPVAWIAFSGNGNIRLWTDDPGRAAIERQRGLDLRAFTLPELVALSARPIANLPGTMILEFEDEPAGSDHAASLAASREKRQ
jgi:hypothetical protein